jgi:hypothetical protein
MSSVASASKKMAVKMGDNKHLIKKIERLTSGDSEGEPNNQNKSSLKEMKAINAKLKQRYQQIVHTAKDKLKREYLSSIKTYSQKDKQLKAKLGKEKARNIAEAKIIKEMGTVTHNTAEKLEEEGADFKKTLKVLKATKTIAAGLVKKNTGARKTRCSIQEGVSL